MASRFVFDAKSADFPTTNFPQIIPLNNRLALAYDAATAESAQWDAIAPQGLTGALTLVITYMMASAVANGIAFDVLVEAISDGDSVDLDAADSFDTANTGTVATVPGTAGFIDQVSITLTNADSVAAGDYLRIRITRAVANATDTATGDLYLLKAELRDAA